LPSTWLLRSRFAGCHSAITRERESDAAKWWLIIKELGIKAE
jgi:hypothetical protein